MIYYFNSLRERPTPKIENKSIIEYLVKTGSSKTMIADALKISFNDLDLFCKRNNIKKGKKLSKYDRIKQFRRNRKILAVLYMGGKCSVCSYLKSFAALDFHHTDPSKKDFSISSNLNKSWISTKKELNKCILLCSNCHREKHDSFIDEQI